MSVQVLSVCLSNDGPTPSIGILLIAGVVMVKSGGLGVLGMEQGAFKAAPPAGPGSVFPRRLLVMCEDCRGDDGPLGAEDRGPPTVGSDTVRQGSASQQGPGQTLHFKGLFFCLIYKVEFES